MNETDYYWKRFGKLVRRRKWMKDKYGTIGMDGSMIWLNANNMTKSWGYIQYYESSDK